MDTNTASVHSFLTQLEVVIYILSMTVSGLFAFVIFSLRRNTRILQDREWTKEFALAFLVLALAYLLRITGSIIEGHGYTAVVPRLYDLIMVLIYTSSGVTNYLFFLVGFRLSDNQVFPRLKDKQWPFQLKEKLTGRSSLRLPLFLFLCILSVIPAIADKWWARIPDSIFSALVLIFLGYILYRKFSVRGDKLMAMAALLSTTCYGLLLLFYGLSQYLMGSNSRFADSSVILISLFLKSGLFLSGYTLMLLISGPIEGVERLLHSVTRQQKDYLESDGILKSISEELQSTRVNLYIKIPNKDKIARYTYPPTNKIDNQTPQILNYEKGTSYDQVLTRSAGDNNSSGGDFFQLPKLSGLAVPVLFHNQIIACLEAKIGNESFREADSSKLQRIAILISPVVQAYREVAAINEISQDNSLLRIDVTTYDLEKHVTDITAIMHNVMSPLATGISIEAGFRKYLGVDGRDQDCRNVMKEHLDSSPGKKNNRNSRLKNCLAQDLNILHLNQKPGDLGVIEHGNQSLGRFVLATEIEEKEKLQLTLSTGLFYGQAVSYLLTDNLLNFVRGYLNERTDELGKRLGGLTLANAESWFEEVDKTAKEARLLWVAATRADSDKLFGEEHSVELVNRLEQAGEWEQKVVRNDVLWVCKLGAHVMDTQHVIKRRLKESRQTLWFGVENPNFGLEMDYVSPWRFFIVQFCDIADSALQSILNKQREEERKKEIAELQSEASKAMKTGIIIHEVVNQVRNWTFTATALEAALRNGDLICNGTLKSLILNLPDSVKTINEQIKWYAGVGKPDDGQPCSLAAAIRDAQKVCEDSLSRYGIKLEHPFSSVSILGDLYYINLSHYIATDILTNIIRNAKDAIRDENIKDGVIQINVEGTESMFICHITDNGPGVPEDVQKTLLKSVTKTQKPYSNGSGLYLSKRWLELNNGTIALTHPGPEPKTTFSVYFPRAKNI